MDLAVGEVLEQHQDLQAGLASLDSLTAEVGDLEFEPEYTAAGDPLARMGLVQEQGWLNDSSKVDFARHTKEV